MSEYKFKNLSDIDTVAEPVEGTTMMGFENGVPIQMPMSAVKGSGNVFIINPDDPEYSTTDTAYGNKVKDALLSGKTVLCYEPTSESYFSIIEFDTFNNSGQLELWVVPFLYHYQSGSVDELRLNFSVESGEFSPQFAYRFNITG